MIGRVVALVVVASTAGGLCGQASAATHHRRHHDRVLNVTRSRGLPVPPDPLVAATANFTGQNGKTTDVDVFPDLSVGDGFYGFQTPGLYSFGFEGGGLTPYQLQ